MCIFFNDTATTEIYTLSLHDALPISSRNVYLNSEERISALSLSKAIFTAQEKVKVGMQTAPILSEMKNIIEATPHTKIDYVDRKSTRLNSSHANISYAVFCLKKIYNY